MLVAGFTALKSLRVGSYLGLLGYFLMLFYLAPALLNTFRGIAKTGRVLEPIRIVFLALIVALPLLALGRLFLNALRIRARARITKPCS